MQNKKGQEGITIGTLLLIVLGVVVVVVLIIGFTKGFGFIFGKQEVLPLQQTQAIAKSCELAASNSLAIDYCAELKSTGTKGFYVTCQYKAIEDAMDKKVSKQVCNSEMNTLLQEKCKVLNPNATSITINNVKADSTCSNIVVRTTP